MELNRSNSAGEDLAMNNSTGNKKTTCYDEVKQDRHRGEAEKTNVDRGMLGKL